SVTARADNISDAVLKDFVTPDRLQQVQGGAFVTIALDADRLSLERIGGTAVLDRAWVTLAGVPFYQNVPTRLRIEDGRASIDTFRWSAEGNSITASGGASLIASRPSIDLAVKGVLDLRALGAFVSGVAAGGT